MPANLLSLALLLPPVASQCLFSSPANSPVKYTFDATALASASGDYQWADTRAMNTASSGSNYTYTFNVCRPVNAVNVPSGTCPQDPNLAAFQWAPPPSSWCVGLGYANPGGDATQQPTYSLLDPADPSYGFNISYASSNTNSICSPSFHLILRCGNNAFPAPNLPAPAGQPAASRSTLITEVGNCKYEAYSWTLAGCPLGAWRRPPAWPHWRPPRASTHSTPPPHAPYRQSAPRQMATFVLAWAFAARTQQRDPLDASVTTAILAQTAASQPAPFPGAPLRAPFLAASFWPPAASWAMAFTSFAPSRAR